METFEGKIKCSETYSSSWSFKLPEPIGYLEHEPTHNKISVYSKIGLFKRIMIRYFFGLKYIKL